MTEDIPSFQRYEKTKQRNQDPTEKQRDIQTLLHEGTFA